MEKDDSVDGSKKVELRDMEAYLRPWILIKKLPTYLFPGGFQISMNLYTAFPFLNATIVVSYFILCGRRYYVSLVHSSSDQEEL